MFKMMAGVALCVVMAAPAAAQDAKIAQGVKVYAEQKCSMCHSIAGKGNKNGVLDDVASKLKAEETASGSLTRRFTRRPRPANP